MPKGVTVELSGHIVEVVRDRRDLPLIVSLVVADDEQQDHLTVTTQRHRQVLSVTSQTTDFTVVGPRLGINGGKTAALNTSTVRVSP